MKPGSALFLFLVMLVMIIVSAWEHTVLGICGFTIAFFLLAIVFAKGAR